MLALCRSEASARPNVVVFDGEVQQIAVLKFDVVFPDAGLQSKIKVFA